MGKLDFGVILRHFRDSLSPKARGVKHVRLVNARQLLAALHRHFKRGFRNPADFGNRIFLGIVRIRFAVFFAGAAFAEINAARKFPDNQNIHAVADNFVFNRRRAFQRFKNGGGAQICVKPQCTANAQQPRFGTVVAGLVIPLRAADRAQKYAVRRLTGVHSFLRKRHAGRVDCHAAHQAVVILHLKAEFFAGGVQNLNRFVHDFRADAVAF